MLIHAGASVNSIGPKAMTPLSLATKYNHTECVDIIHAAGGEVFNIPKNSHIGNLAIISQMDNVNEILPLLWLSRNKIRYHLMHVTEYNHFKHKNLVQCVPQLPLPERMKTFLLYGVDMSFEGENIILLYIHWKTCSNFHGIACYTCTICFVHINCSSWK